jgi:hypothetical protein
LTLAGGNDVLAFYLSTEVELLTLLFRALAIILPVVVWVVAFRYARARSAAADIGPRPHPRRRAGTGLRRTPSGGFEEVDP